jgi:diguanylate cyclase (GGDEF)-like protein/PAS domain S-box-containing protein
VAPRIMHGHPVVIIGAGRGGSALLELFKEESLVEVVAVADPDQNAIGIKLAKGMGIPTYKSAREALQACKDYPDCLIYNLTHDDTVAREVAGVFGNKNVSGGVEANLFWQMVTNLRQIRKELEKSQQQLQAVIQNAMDGIIIISESGDIHGFNPAAEKIFGYSQQEALGINVKMLMPEPRRSEHDGYILRYLQTGEGRVLGVRGREVTAMRKNGELFPLELSASEMSLGGQRYFIGIIRDITERKEAEKRITYLAHHDYLTGLPNRALFMDRLERALLLAKRNQYKEALLFLDLDEFKRVNDTLGHDSGDMLLQEAAKRLNKVTRASDTAARLGGDEFAVILNNVKEKEEAAIVAKKIIAEVSAPFDLKGQRCEVGCSVGIALFPDDSEDSASLLRHADEAMYRSKQRGKNTFTFYSASRRG